MTRGENDPFFGDNANPGICLHNAFRNPSPHLKHPADADPKLFATCLQHLLIPTLNAHQILNECDHYAEEHMQRHSQA